MNDSLELIKKIHTGIDETCYASILANWSKMKIDGYEIAERLFDLVSSGVSEEAAAEICEIDHEEAKALLDEYGKNIVISLIMICFMTGYLLKLTISMHVRGSLRIKKRMSISV